jgi:hypothetical protein
MNGTLPEMPKQFLVPISPRIAPGWPTSQIWDSLTRRYKQCKFGRNRSVMKGTLFVRPKEFLQYLASHYSEGPKTSHLVFRTHELQAMKVWWKSVGNERGFTREAETLFVHISPRISAGWPKQHTWHSTPIRYKQCMFGRNPSVMKGTLLDTSKEFFVPVSPRIASGCPKRQNWNSPLMRYKHDKFGRHRSVMKGTSLARPRHFFFTISLRISAGWPKRHTWHSTPMR